MRYLRRTKGYMLTLEIIMYSDFDFAGCQDSKHSMSRYIYMLTLIVSLTIAIEFVSCFETSNQRISFVLADPLTKGLIPKK
ncbi:hypothetical protein CR513_39568, partial [Mucuna pruriens]